MAKIEINGKKGVTQAKLADATSLEATFSGGVPQVSLQSAGVVPTPDQQALWSAIRTRTRWMSYPVFEEVLRRMGQCGNETGSLKGSQASFAQHAAKANLNENDLRTDGCFHGPEAYNLLRATAEAFLAFLCVPNVPSEAPSRTSRKDTRQEIIDEEAPRNDALGEEENWTAFKGYLSPASYPYLDKIKPAILSVASPFCDGLRECLCPVELIWSYWHEEGMLVQSLNAICLRFQNRRSPNMQDPLAALRLSPLRPLSSLLWGYIQNEHDRLTVARRAYEYDHEYGLRLKGKVVSEINPVDSRSKFLEAFHNLLYVTTRFYKEADDTTVKADAFPVLNALKELHLILAFGAHNQFGDLPWTARAEMLVQEWLMARPEIREFLGGAPMVPYKETWMSHVDSMKTLQGWTDVSVTHYRDLGVYGEQILLSIRYADWNSDDATQDNAYNWAIYWRMEVQSYIHSYRCVTGVDLAAEITDTRRAAERYVQPSVHQARRLQAQRSKPPQLSNGQRTERPALSNGGVPARSNGALAKP